MLGLVTTAAAAESGGAHMPQFDVTTFSSQIFWLAIAVAVLFLGLRWLILPRIEESVANRNQAVSSDRRRAQKLTQNATELQEELQRQTAELHQRTTEIARQQHEATLQQIAQLESEAAARIDEAGKAGEARIRELRSSALEDVTAVAKEVANAVVQNLLPNTDHRAATDSAVDRQLQPRA